MNTKIININNINIHIIENKNFKTTRMEARLILDVNKKEVPLLELLSNALIYTSKNYKTRKDFVNHQKDLYDTLLIAGIQEEGYRTSLEIAMAFLADKYSYDGLLEDEIKNLYEVLYNPNIDNNSYDEGTYNAILLNYKAYIESLKEDKSKYSRLRLDDIINEDNANYISKLDKEYYKRIVNSTREELASIYNTVINNSKLDIVVLGDIDIDKTEKLFNKIFKDCKCKNIDINPIKNYEVNKKIITRFEADKSSQSKLDIACVIDKNLTKYQKEVVLQVYNMILGGFANSLFFKNIREKYSLCYYISSNVSYYENSLFIRSGITKENYDKVVDLIKKEMKKLVKGDIPKGLLEDAKKSYITALTIAMDYPSSLVNNYYDNKIDNISLFKDRIEEINKVTIDDIKEVANKIKMNTVFLFGGDSK